jgi:hypothetical protein
MKFWKNKKTTVGDIESWLVSIYKNAELELSEFKVPDEERSWLSYFSEIPLYINIDMSDSENPTIILNSNLCEIPLKKEQILPFYRKCLELNAFLFGASLTVKDTRVSFFQKRDIEFMSEPILSDMIRYQISITERVLKDLAGEFEIVPSKPE